MENNIKMYLGLYSYFFSEHLAYKSRSLMEHYIDIDGFINASVLPAQSK